MLATVANGDGGDYAHYLLGPDGQWKQLTQFSDQIKTGASRPRRCALSAFASRCAAWKSFATAARQPELAKATVIVPAGEAVIQQLSKPTADALYVGELLGGPSQIRRFDLDGKNEKTIVDSADLGRVGNGRAGGRLASFRDVSYIEPAAWYHCDAGKRRAGENCTA